MGKLIVHIVPILTFVINSAMNTIVAPRAGKDLISSLAADSVALSTKLLLRSQMLAALVSPLENSSTIQGKQTN